MINIPSVFKKLLNQAKSLVMEEINPDVTSGQSLPESITGETMAEMPTVPAPEPAPVKKVTRLKVLTAILNGIGIGLLLGMLVSLSLSPVVSGVIAALTGLLAVLLGLDEKYIDPLKSIRIGTFGLAAAAGIIIGLYIRASNPFAPTLVDKLNLYREIGYSEDEARAFITKFIESDTGLTRREAPVLYTSTVDAGACDDLQYAGTDQPLNEIYNTYSTAGGTWKEFAGEFKSSGLPDDVIALSLISLRDVFCNLDATGGKIEVGKLSGSISKKDDTEQIENVLNSSGESWKAIVNKISDKIADNYRKEVYLVIIQVLTHK